MSNYHKNFSHLVIDNNGEIVAGGSSLAAAEATATRMVTSGPGPVMNRQFYVAEIKKVISAKIDVVVTEL